MYRNELDFLHVEGARQRDPAHAEPSGSDNSPAQVFWEIGVVLAVTLGIAALINVAVTGTV